MMKFFFLISISIIPFSKLRIFLYKKLFGFKIGKNAKIGMLNLLDIETLIMEDNTEIRGIGNIFLSMHKVEMKKYSRIGGPRLGMNFFRGTANKKDYPPSVLELGYCTVIELLHYFDLCGNIFIGDNTVIGGIKSVFFTHSIHKPEFDPIIIGDNVYVGSNCLFQMGTRIPDNSALGMGSVVINPIENENTLIAGVPAKVVKENFDYCAEKAFMLRKKVFYKNGKFIQPT